MTHDAEAREAAASKLVAFRDARAAYYDDPVPLIERSDGMAARCAISGLPLTEDDEYVEDTETGEMWLRSALGLSPREIVEIQTDDADTVEAAQ